jgi:hypothetical protein
MHVPAGQLNLSLRIAICAWCEPQPPGGAIGALSHGICPRHFRKLVLESQSPQPKRRRRAAASNDTNREALLRL